MKHLAAAALIACSMPALVYAQAQTQEPLTGVSTPPPMNAEATPAPRSALPEGYRPTPTLQVRTAAPEQSFAGTPTPEAATPGTARRTAEDVDANIVTTVPHAANEAPLGTLVKVRMNETLSTRETPLGSPFSAQLTEPITEGGRILIPAGTLLSGHITEVHGGRRIRGAAALHLDPRKLTLPNGAVYEIRGQVVDTSESFATHIDSEGTIVRRDHVKQTLAAMTLTTGASAAAGAVIGGGVGALVGAGIGAGVSTAWWLKQDRQTVLPENTAVTFSLNEPLAISTPAR